MTDTNAIAEELIKEILGFNKKRLVKMHDIALYQGEFAMLACIFRLQEGSKDITPSLLSSVLNISRPSVTSTLNSLEAKGFVVRQMDKNDRRKMVVFITPEGEKIINYKFNCMLNTFKYVTKNLGEKDSTEFLRLLKLAFHHVADYHAQMEQE